MLQLFLLGKSFNFSVQSLLDQYDEGHYVPTLTDNINRVYDVGLNHLLNRMNHMQDQNGFFQCFHFAKRLFGAWIGNSSVFGEFTETVAYGQSADYIVRTIAVQDSELNIAVESSQEQSLRFVTFQGYEIFSHRSYGNLYYELKFRPQTSQESNIRLLKLSLFATDK